MTNDPVQEFSYKPALLRRAQHYTLQGNVLTGPAGALDLTQVSQAAYVSLDIRGHETNRLDLIVNGKRHSLSITLHRTTRADDPDRICHQNLIQAVLGQLATIDPNLRVVLGEYGRARTVMFWVGVLSLLVSVGVFIAALASGIGGDRIMAVAIPTAVLALFGGAIMFSNAPWKPVPTISVSDLARDD